MTNAPTLLEEIIDGIEAADIPDGQKHTLLKRIEEEGGIQSEDLRKALAEMFEGQAEQEREKRGSIEAQLHRMDTEASSPAPDDPADEEAHVVAEIVAEQQAVMEDLQKNVGEMREDIVRVERNEAAKREAEKSKGEQSEIERLRKGLERSGQEK